ncbi:hypothetical protein E2320_007114, partial [Naja naja]
MGQFMGHVLPGIFFTLFGLWWSVKYSLKHISRTQKKNSYIQRNFKHVEITEGAVKVVLGLVGILGEQFVPDGPHFYLYRGQPRSWVKLMNWQHSTILRPMLDQHIHAMLLTAIFAAVATCFIQVFVHDNVILDLFLVCLALLHGTWLWQIGFVLYPPWGEPEWDLNDHSNLMFISMCFCWHFALAILITAVNYTLVYCYFQNCKSSNRQITIGLGIRKQMNAHVPLINESDEEG